MHESSLVCAPVKRVPFWTQPIGRSSSQILLPRVSTTFWLRFFGDVSTTNHGPLMKASVRPSRAKMGQWEARPPHLPSHPPIYLPCSEVGKEALLPHPWDSYWYGKGKLLKSSPGEVKSPRWKRGVAAPPRRNSSYWNSGAIRINSRFTEHLLWARQCSWCSERWKERTGAKLSPPAGSQAYGTRHSSI